MFAKYWEQEWYVWFPSSGELSSLPPEVKVLPGGQVHILDIPDTDEEKEFGYIATRDSYRNYRLSLDYRWESKKFAPRKEAKRDSGILYHVYGKDAVWPSSMEYQIQETDTGDYHLLWMKERPYMNIRVAADKDAQTDRHVFQKDGELAEFVSGSVQRSEMVETDGWNKVELIVRGQSSEHYLNGVLVNSAEAFFTHECAPLDQGRIGLQVEGAEIRYRNVEITPLTWPAEHEPFNVLVFSRTTAFRHASIPDGIAAIWRLGERFKFSVDATEDPNAFTDENLAKYKVVIFLSTTGDVLNDEQQAAFERFIQSGKGFVGIHAASDTEYDWPWYEQLVGAYFMSHPSHQTARVYLLDDDETSTAHLPHSWVRFDEWYDFRKAPRSSIQLLLAVDESSYQGGKMGEMHPMSWQHEFDGGRAWYTALGHTSESFFEPHFLMHILGGIQYAAGLPNALR